MTQTDRLKLMRWLDSLAVILHVTPETLNPKNYVKRCEEYFEMIVRFRDAVSDKRTEISQEWSDACIEAAKRRALKKPKQPVRQANE